MLKNTFRLTFVVLTTTYLLKCISGNIFTEPTKLLSLFDFQLRLSKILQIVSDEELANVPQDVLIGLVR